MLNLHSSGHALFIVEIASYPEDSPHFTIAPLIVSSLPSISPFRIFECLFVMFPLFCYVVRLTHVLIFLSIVVIYYIYVSLLLLYLRVCGLALIQLD